MFNKEHSTGTLVACKTAPRKRKADGEACTAPACIVPAVQLHALETYHGVIAPHVCTPACAPMLLMMVHASEPSTPVLTTHFTRQCMSVEPRACSHMQPGYAAGCMGQVTSTPGYTAGGMLQTPCGPAKWQCLRTPWDMATDMAAQTMGAIAADGANIQDPQRMEWGAASEAQLDALVEEWVASDWQRIERGLLGAGGAAVNFTPTHSNSPLCTPTPTPGQLIPLEHLQCASLFTPAPVPAPLPPPTQAATPMRLSTLVASAPCCSSSTCADDTMDCFQAAYHALAGAADDADEQAHKCAAALPRAEAGELLLDAAMHSADFRHGLGSEEEHMLEEALHGHLASCITSHCGVGKESFSAACDALAGQELS